jgi:phage baseplate assembly protein W
MATLLGFNYPVTPSSLGYFYSAKDTDVLKADLLQLLLTNPGERVMMPEYGTGLRKLIFDPADSIMADTAKGLISNAIKRWEPRIAVTAINTSIDEENNLLKISIEFVDPQNINEVEVLDLELPL